MLHAGVGFIYLVSGLLPPLWGVAILIVLWLGMSVFLVRALRRGNVLHALAMPVAGGVLWFAVVQGLGTLFDWTA